MALLEVKDLQVYYGVIRALKGISFHVDQGEIVSLIGANGAGKTTTMQSIMRLIPIKSGSVVYDGNEINKIPGHKLVGMGMSQVPEGRRVFQELTVYENLLLGAYTQKDKKKIKRGYRRDLHPLPPPRREKVADSGHSFRRRTADARNGQSYDEPPEAAHAR